MVIKIGVLGGIGPEATGEFYNRLILSLQKNGLVKNNQEYPQIIINSISAPELVEEKITNSDLEPYITGLKELDKLKPDFIVMVCNTIHLFREFLQGKIKAPILDLRQEVREYLSKMNVKSALVIGTRNTLNKGLYKFDDIKYILPNEKEQLILSESIINFNKGLDKEEQIEKTKKICLGYIREGAETVILGCTEFAVMLQNEKFSKVNTIEIMVESVIGRFKVLSSL